MATRASSKGRISHEKRADQVRANFIDMTYKLLLHKKKATVYANIHVVQAICGELVLITRQRKELYKLSPA